MNTNTGRIYELGEPVSSYLDFAQSAGRGASFPQAEARARRRLTPDERDAVSAVRAGEQVVPVSREVAQAVTLGRRELDRRARRRKAAKAARKRNRYA